MLQYEKLANGKLRLFVSDEDRPQLKEELEQHDEMRVWFDIIDPLRANGRLYPIDAEHIGALTSDPYLLTDDLDIEDDGTYNVRGNVWYYDDYAIKSLLEEIVERGEVVMDKAPPA